MKKRDSDDIDMQLVAKWKATGKLPPNEDIIDALFVVFAYHDGEEEAPILRDLIDLIAHKLDGSVAWGKAQARARAREGKGERAKLQARADAMWASNPAWSRTEVARYIGKESGGNIDTIRKRIIKK